MRRILSQAVRPVVEKFENRLLMSVAMATVDVNGILFLTGTNQADTFDVALNNDQATGVTKALITFGTGQKATTKLFPDIEGLNVEGLGGADTITMHATGLTNSNVFTSVRGGAGKDHIFLDGFDGHFYGDGGEGNDLFDARDAFAPFTIADGWTFRTFSGGGGNDTMHGSGATDYLYGDAGDDVMNGNDGDDVLDGGIGNNSLRGNKGDDTFQVRPLEGLGYPEGGEWQFGGHDDINGGAGEDTIQRLYSSKTPTVTFGDTAIKTEKEMKFDVDDSGKG